MSRALHSKAEGMRRGWLALVAGGFGVMLLCGTSWAQQSGAATALSPSGAAPLTLAQAYRLALENDASLRAARAATDARRERLPQAQSRLLPSVSATATRFRNHLDSTTPGLFGGTVTSNDHYSSSSRALTLRQALFRPYEMADLRQAEAQVADAEARLSREVQNLAVRVTTAYMEALLSQEQLALVLGQKAEFETQVDAARKKLAGGAGTRTDIDEAQARLDMAIAQELEARQNVTFTRRQLQMLVNHPVQDVAALNASRLPLGLPVPPGLPPAPDLEQWVERAEQISPEIHSLIAQRESARHEIQKARSGHLPTLDAVAQWSISNNDQVTRINARYDNRALGLQLQVPIYAGGFVDSRTRQAIADLERADHALEATRRDLALRVEKEYRGVTEGILRVRALEQAVRSAETVVASSRRSYQAGSRTLLDILNAEEQKLRAQRDLADARYDYLLSRMRLLALSGLADVAAIDESSSWLSP